MSYPFCELLKFIIARYYISIIQLLVEVVEEPILSMSFVFVELLKIIKTIGTSYCSLIFWEFRPV